MTTAKQRLADKANRMRASKGAAKAAPEAAAPARPVPTTAAPLAKPVRCTVDLAPARYRALQDWLNEEAVRLGVSRITKQQALDALVGLLLTDEVTSRKIVAELRKSQ